MSAGARIRRRHRGGHEVRVPPPHTHTIALAAVSTATDELVRSTRTVPGRTSEARAPRSGLGDRHRRGRLASPAPWRPTPIAGPPGTMLRPKWGSEVPSQRGRPSAAACTVVRHGPSLSAVCPQRLVRAERRLLRTRASQPRRHRRRRRQAHRGLAACPHPQGHPRLWRGQCARPVRRPGRRESAGDVREPVQPAHAITVLP